MTPTAAPDDSDTAANLAGYREDSVTARGDRIHYLVGGDADADRTVVLLHGGIIDAAHITWRPLLEPLAESATVYAPHLPGYGPSPMPDAPLTVGRHVESAAALLAELDLEAPTVAGISMGGGVAVGLGLEHPDRVDDLVALDAMALGSELSGGRLTWLLARLEVTNVVSVAMMRRSRSYVRAGLEQLFAEDGQVSELLVELVHEEVQRPDAGAAFRNFRANEVTWHGYRTDYSDRLPHLEVPTRLLHGREDEVMPLSWSQRAEELIPDASLRVLEGCGHLPTWERTEAVREAVLDEP